MQVLHNNLSHYPPALTAAQVSEILQIPVKTVYDLGARGKLPRVKLGRTVRFPLRHIAGLLDNTKEATAQ